MRAVIAISILALLGAAGAGVQSGRTRGADPLDGSWRPVRIGTVAVPAAAEARLFFSGGSEYSTQAGCGNFGGFYWLDGGRIRVRQRDPVRIGKCPDRASARLETALAGFIAQAATYELSPDGSLRIVARDGRIGLFRRPLPAIQALDGLWLVETIGRDNVLFVRRSQLLFRDDWLSVGAGCNQYGARIRAVGSGFIVTGGAATERACDADSQAFDARLFAAIGKARRWVQLPGRNIRLEGGGEPLVLTRPPTMVR